MTDPSLGKGFAMLAQAVVQVAQQVRIANQLNALQIRADYMGASVATSGDFRRIESELFPTKEGAERG